MPSVLLLTPASSRPELESLKKIKHEYSFRDDLDTTWAARPLALSQWTKQKALVLEDLGGEPLHRLIQGPMGTRQFLRIAIGLAAALSQLHKRKLIRKDIKPSNAPRGRFSQLCRRVKLQDESLGLLQTVKR